MSDNVTVPTNDLLQEKARLVARMVDTLMMQSPTMSFLMNILPVQVSTESLLIGKDINLTRLVGCVIKILKCVEDDQASMDTMVDVLAIEYTNIRIALGIEQVHGTIEETQQTHHEKGKNRKRDRSQR